MKIGKLLLAGVIALGMMACNNEEVPDPGKTGEATISIKVFPSGNGPSVRLAGDVSATGTGTIAAAESAIKNVEVWIFAGDVLDGYKKGENDALEVKLIKATAGTGRTIVVVANAGIGTVSSLATLKAKVRSLGQTTDGGLIMTAIVEDIELKTGQNQYGYPEAADIHNLSTTKLPLTRINARVALVGLSYAFTDLPYNKFELTEVAMFNAREKSKLFGTSLVAGRNDGVVTNYDFLYGRLTGGTKYPSSGSSYVGSDGYPTGGFTADGWFALVQSFTPNAELTAPALVNAKNAHYFYAFENGANTAANEGTFIVLKGKLFNGTTPYIAAGLHTDAAGFTYYPVWVNADKTGYTYNDDHTPDGTIIRNTQYNITVTLTKAGNPTIDEPEDAFLDVYVEVTPWVVVEQTVEW